MVYPFGNVPLNLNASTHGNAPSSSSNFLNNKINGNATNATNNNGIAPNANGNAPLTHFNMFFVILQKKIKKIEKEQNPESKN